MGAAPGHPALPAWPARGHARSRTVGSLLGKVALSVLPVLPPGTGPANWLQIQTRIETGSLLHSRDSPCSEILWLCFSNAGK